MIAFFHVHTHIPFLACGFILSLSLSLSLSFSVSLPPKCTELRLKLTSGLQMIVILKGLCALGLGKSMASCGPERFLWFMVQEEQL